MPGAQAKPPTGADRPQPLRLPLYRVVVGALMWALAKGMMLASVLFLGLAAMACHLLGGMPGAGAAPEGTARKEEKKP